MSFLRLFKQGPMCSSGPQVAVPPSTPEAAFVTAFGQGRRRCNVTSISTNSTFQVIGVRCRDLDSQLVDNLFYLSYLR